ncbi:putative fatty acyl-CoA reductase CG5065 [Chironomus tepperi]|uniref:putative fatty acyl-CoA reductase CG5065 n=1 Tax=Chironomus tepperi TaxID=113505 RepID=UPI00391FC393
MKFPNGHFHPFMLHDQMIENLLKKDEPLNHLPTIPEFFAAQEIFITGGTGFLGKVLIEKLLRSCPDIKTIYILLRPKKGQSVNERLRSLCDQVVFDALRVCNPNFMDKLVAVKGDVSELGLGLSEFDKTLMKDVTIVYHSAASVRFDDSIKYAVLMNTRGTRELMEFATTLKNIKCVMHVSTTFSNLGHDSVKEEIYPGIADWRKTIEICEKMDENILNFVTKKYTNLMPNTYVFSKNLAESVTQHYSDRLPVIVFRPSIILSAWTEPFQGYVDNFNGPMGILLASHIGISKTMLCDPKNVLDMLPVDVCVKAMIISTWKRVHEQLNDLQVINAASAKTITVTINQLLDIGIHGVCEEFPPGKLGIFVQSGGVTLCGIWNLIRCFFYQLIPAMIIDTALKMKGMKPRLMKLQRKMFEANKALTYFTTHNFDFQNENFLKLSSYLRPEDYKAFEIASYRNYSIITYCRFAIYGFRRYLLNVKDEDLEKDRQRERKIRLATSVFKYLVYFALFYIVIFKTNILSYLRQSRHDLAISE